MTFIARLRSLLRAIFHCLHEIFLLRAQNGASQVDANRGLPSPRRGELRGSSSLGDQPRLVRGISARKFSPLLVTRHLSLVTGLKE